MSDNDTKKVITQKIDYEGREWTLADAHKKWVTDTISEKGDVDNTAHASRFNIPNRFRAWLAGEGLVAEGRECNYEYPVEADYGIPIERPEELTFYHHIGWYKALHEQGWASSTIDSYHTLLSMWVRWMSERNIVDEEFYRNLRDKADPKDIDGINLKKGFKEEQFKEEIQYATPEDVEEMCKYVTSPKTQQELMVRLMFQTGVREKELRFIEKEDVDREKREIQVITAKTGELRSVYYHPSLDVLMDKYWESDRERLTYSDSMYLFPTDRSPQMARNTPNRIIKRLAKKAGIQDYTEPDAAGRRRRRITAHALRHGFGVQCAKNEMHVRSIQRLLGHSDISQTMKYLRFTNNDVKEEYASSGPME